MVTVGPSPVHKIMSTGNVHPKKQRRQKFTRDTGEMNTRQAAFGFSPAATQEAPLVKEHRAGRSQGPASLWWSGWPLRSAELLVPGPRLQRSAQKSPSHCPSARPVLKHAGSARGRQELMVSAQPTQRSCYF